VYQRIRPMIFRLAPEHAHEVTIALLRLAGAIPPARLGLRWLFRPGGRGPAVQAFGLTFPNPVGLAAGYDKDGLAWRGLSELGFGHIEVGTVTPRPQSGNPQPRIFRLVEDRAVINRMGFPSQGGERLARRLRAPRPKGLILGINIGKNKATPLEEAVQDYMSLVRTFAPLADYLAINVSSPNTPGLRALQSRQALEGLLRPLAEERGRQVRHLGRPLPLLVKLAPDLASSALDEALDVIVNTGMDGVVVSNTTLHREGLRSALSGETGGLSGAPLKSLNTELVRAVARRTAGELPIIASGGIMCREDLREKLDAGAVLVQLYTGLIYEGPGLVRRVLERGFV
jgi:dihydroorotate dehydrogenase